MLSCSCGYYAVFSISVATYLYSVPHVPDTYVRGPHFLFSSEVCVCFSYHVYYYLLFFPRDTLPLQSYWSLSCDHGLNCVVAMSECDNNNNSHSSHIRFKLLQ